MGMNCTRCNQHRMFLEQMKFTLGVRHCECSRTMAASKDYALGGALLWSSICGEGLTTNTYREAEEADQQQLVTQLSRATKVIRDLEGVPDLRDDQQREALYDDDEA